MICTKRRIEQGFSLVELVFVVAILAIVLGIGVPMLDRLSAGLRLRLAAEEVSAVLHRARMEAVRFGNHVAVRFRQPPEGPPVWALFRDGDGDGVRNVDIRAGIDPPLTLERPMGRLSGGIHPGFPQEYVPRDPGNPGRFLDRLEDPIRFNRSGLASFGALGSSTPGTIYLTDGRRRLMAVRVNGRAGRVRILTYDEDDEVWRQ